MNTKEISEKEFAIIQKISNSHISHQRMLAQETGMSLGLTNLIMKRLIEKGFVKAKQLNQRKVQYILTPKGFIQRAKKSYLYTLKTINLLQSMKEKVQELISIYHKEGKTNYLIIGNNELSSIALNAFKSFKSKDINYSHILIEDFKNNQIDEEKYICFITEDIDLNLKNSVKLISYLSETGIFI